MNAEEAKRERLSGWVLAAVLFIHMILLRDAAGLLAPVFVILLVGVILRARGVFVPNWAGRVLLLAGVLLVAVLEVQRFSFALPGEMAGIAAAMMLLRPVTPSRGRKILCCILITLVSIVLQPFPGVGVIFEVVDVILLMILAELIHRPPEVAVSLWVSLMRSLRVVVPVALVVLLVFNIFPSLSLPPASVFTGFTGGASLDPGMIAELAQSRRVALVAHFTAKEFVPPAEELYWRGQVLERNEGLRWTRDIGRRDRQRSLLNVQPPQGTVRWQYRQEMDSNRGGILPVLDRAVAVDARRGEQEVAVLDLGASVLSANGSEPMTLEVISASDRVSDPPEEVIALGGVNVPKYVWSKSEIVDIAGQVVSSSKSTVENFQAIADYLRDSGFSYTMRPGRVGDLAVFFKQRRGFCEHYAAATANLLRLGGVPARIVTGYRGGEWNPWLNTLTVRDSDAHAWVEAWDAPSGRWLRFDPTNYVAPDLLTNIVRELDSDHWPWYRNASSFVTAGMTTAAREVSDWIDRITSSTFWEYLQPVLFGAYVIFATVWLIRRSRRQNVKSPAGAALREMQNLEALAARRRKPRLPGETPLAWIARLAGEASDPTERRELHHFARSYEDTVYRETGGVGDMKIISSRLRKIWNAAPWPQKS